MLDAMELMRGKPPLASINYDGPIIEGKKVSISKGQPPSSIEIIKRYASAVYPDPLL